MTSISIDDIALVLQQNRLHWYGHVLWKEDDDWVKKCTEYEAEGPRPRGRPKRTRREVVLEDCQARKMNRVDAIDHCKWRKMIKDARWSGWVWVGECFFCYWPTRVVPDQRPLNGCVSTNRWTDKPGSKHCPHQAVTKVKIQWDLRQCTHYYRMAMSWQRKLWMKVLKETGS